ncbi:extracellular solute-binding protein [Ruminococcaceae bacterium OttesenSCG-928-D13]|nr:extracellular solute-binding protein [Ruminococcaceae bacterium OttesenSCG-928-D13]
MKSKSGIRSLSALALAVVLLAALLAGCGGTPESTPAAPSTADPVSTPAESTPAATGGTITVAASQNWVKDIDREIAEMFTAETGIAVDFQLSPDDQYQTIVKSKLNTGEGTDIFMSNSGAKLRDFNPAGTMADLSAEPWVGSMKQWAIDGSSYDGTLYGFNQCSVDGTNGVLYQPEMFEQYDLEVPTNYEEFKNVCKVLNDNGVLPIYEFVKDLWHAHYWMEGVAPAAQARDPEVLDKLNRNEIGFADVPEFVTALAQIKELADLGYLGENHLSNTYDKSYEAIATGEAAMIIIHSSYPNELMQNLPEVDPDKFSMFPNPLADNTGITLTAGGTTRCINAGSDNVEAAKQYFEFMARPEIAQLIYDARTDYMEASVEGVNGTPTKANEAIAAVAVRNMGPEAYVYFYDGGKISELMQEMFVGSLSPEEVLQEFDTHRRSLAKDAEMPGF